MRFYKLTHLMATLVIAWMSISAEPVLADAYQDGLHKAVVAILKKVEVTGLKSGTVLDFADLQGDATELGKYVAQDFADDLVNSANTFQLLDRTNLKQLLKENQMSTDGLVDPKTSQSLGNLIGIDTVLVGTVTPSGANAVHLSVRAVALGTGRIVATSSVDLPLSGTLAELSSHGIVGSPSGNEAKGADKSLADRLTPSSFKLVAKQLLIPQDILGWGQVQYAVENHTGAGLNMWLKSGSYTAGPCSSDLDNEAKGLPLATPNYSPPPPAFVPNAGVVRGTLVFGGQGCNVKDLGRLDPVAVTMSLEIKDGDQLIEVPLSTDGVSVGAFK